MHGIRDGAAEWGGYNRRIMVSRGLGAFLDLLLVLVDVGIIGGVMYGRCPECWRPISSANPGELIGDLLIHELYYHPEHAGSFE